MCEELKIRQCSKPVIVMTGEEEKSLGVRATAVMRQLYIG